MFSVATRAIYLEVYAVAKNSLISMKDIYVEFDGEVILNEIGRAHV